MRTFKRNIKGAGQLEKEPSFDRSMKQKHKEDLGLGLPENYFSASKERILSLTTEKKKEGKVVKLRKAVIWAVAAGIAVILTLTVFNENAVEKVDGISTKISDTLEQIKLNPRGADHPYTAYDYALIASLFLNEDQIDRYAEDHFLQEIIVDEYIDIYFMDHDSDDEFIFD